MTFRCSSMVLLLTMGLQGCVGWPTGWETTRQGTDTPVLMTSPVRSNVTPISPALSCYGELMQQHGVPSTNIAVGNVRDYTGRFGPDEGNVITQGGSLMTYSALGLLAPTIQLLERFDTSIADAELAYSQGRHLGDGRTHQVPEENGGTNEVPWLPYFGGGIRQSDYFIIGGITEVNWNIQSGGLELAMNNVGPRARRFTMNVAVDLRIVGTQSLQVYDTVTLQKQISGYEVGFGVFRFFDSELFDVNIGAQNQEPLQLGVRMAIESAVLQLVAGVTHIDPAPCITEDIMLVL